MRWFILFLALMTTSFAHAEMAVLGEVEDEQGTLNPSEMTLSKSLQKTSRGEVNMVICSQGYMMTKSGNHDAARVLFEECAKQGWTGTMTWMSYMDTNGFGSKENPEAAAEWDRKAAEAGDIIGKFNYGLNLLRGHGVEQNLDLGKHYIDEAAKGGFKDAIRLKNSDYDPNEVTPDADNWRYEKRVF